MATEEIDVIKHLIDVEREASGIVLEAQKKADALITDAKSKADQEFHDSYSKLVKEVEVQEESAKEKIISNHNEEIQNYKNNLNVLEKNQTEFDSLMNTVFFA